jgi:hypothetical protein
MPAQKENYFRQSFQVITYKFKKLQNQPGLLFLNIHFYNGIELVAFVSTGALLFLYNG